MSPVIPLTLEQELTMLRAFVNEQAEDEGLWIVASTASEAYLQQELRALHRLVERVTEKAKKELEKL